MTFTEAAVEVLRLAGKPLHYKKITEIAIEQDLLSHVGKTPEITMSSRLATMVKKDRGDAPIVKIKPGVFGLREFPEEVLEAAQDDSGHDFKLADVKESKKNDSVEDEGAEASESPAEDAGGEETADDEKKKKKPARKLPGSDVFPEEDDDDEPILANLDDESKDGDEEGGKRGKRRRRRRRGRKEGEEESAEAPEEQRSGRRSRRGGEQGQGRSRGRERGSDRDRGRDQGRRGKSVPDGDWERLAAESDAVGSDLANAIEAALGGRGRQAKSYGRIAESLVRKGRLSGEAASLAPTIAAAVRSDGAAREALGIRPRFRMVEGGIALTSWGLPGDAIRAEGDAIKAATRQRQQVLRAFIRQLGDLPAAGFMEILASWLNAEGVEGLRAVRRNGSNSQDFHLAGTLVRGPIRLPVALVVSRSGGNVNAARVVDVRGGLHHYGDAREAWIICLGQVSKDAREEAAGTGAAPVAIFDGLALATAMESRGIGIRRYSLPIIGLDDELLETLRGPGRATRVAPDEEKGTEKNEEPGAGENDAAEESADADVAPEKNEGEAEEVAADETAEEVTSEGDIEGSSDGDASEAPAADGDDESDDASEGDDGGDDDAGDDDGDDDDDDDAEISGAKSDDDDEGDDEKN